MKAEIWASMICLLVLMPGLLQYQCQAQGAHNQTTYCEDDGPDVFALSSDSLPKAVIDSVMNSTESKGAQGGTGNELNPEKILRAARIRLSRDDAAEFVIVGSPPLSGADGSWFWIVRWNRAKASVLLWVAGNCLDLKSSKTRGYRDIEVLWASAGSERTITYHYDGETYQLARSQIHERGSKD